MSLVMPILPGETRVRVYTASAGQTQFAASFPFQANADILVQYTPAGETVLADLVEGDDYTLTGAGTASGGILTLVAPAAAGDKVTITGKAVLSRVSSVVQAGVFRSITLDEEFDRNRIIQQEFARDIDRQLLVPPGQTGGTIFMPADADRYLLTDGNGNLVDGGSAADIANAQENAELARSARIAAEEAETQARIARDQTEDILAAAGGPFLPLTGGTLSGTLRLATALFARAAAPGGQARVDFERSDGTVSGRLWHVGGANSIALDLHSTDGGTLLTRIEMSGNTPGTVTIGGSPVITAANTQSYLLLPSYVSGMAVSYVNATTCGVATGQARIGATPVEVAAAMTKRLDAVWAPGSGNGGLDTGVVQPNQTYHLRVIRNATTSVADLLWSASATAPTMPSGWTSIQRLQAVKTDGSGNIRPFVTDGRETRLVTPVEEYSGGTRALALLTCAGLPTGVRVQGIFRSVLNIPGSSDSGITHIVADATNSSIQEILQVYNSTGAKRLLGQLRGYTNTSAQVQFAVTPDGGSAGTNTLTTLGWIDHSIPRI